MNGLKTNQPNQLHPTQSHHAGSGVGAAEKQQEEVEVRAALFKSAMMEMEQRRLGALAFLGSVLLHVHTKPSIHTSTSIELNETQRR